MSVFLHLGAPKTGTTYLQHVLSQNRHALARAGVCYPGRGPDHFHAVQDLLGMSFAGWEDPRTEGAWDRLVTEVRGRTGADAVISHELLTWASRQTIARTVGSLEDEEVHVVYTVRDLGRLVPAMWQESLKNRNTVPLGKALRRMRDHAGTLEPGTPPLARAINPAGVLDRWTRMIPRERIHVLVLGRDRPPDQLWRDFAGLIGVDPAPFETSAPANASLGVGEAELLRRVNRVLGKDAMDWPDYDRLIKHELVPLVLTPEATTRITLPPDDHAWVAEWAREQAGQLRAAGYHRVGDLDEIIPEEPADPPARVREADVNRAAVRALAHLARRLAGAEGSRRGVGRWARNLGRSRPLARVRRRS